MNLISSEENKKTKVSVGAMLSVMELVIAIGMFAIISTFLLRFFTLANRLSDEASELSKAAISAEAMMEHIKGVGFEATVKEFNMEEDGEVVKVFYDENYRPATTTAAFVMKITRKPEKMASGVMSQYHIQVIKLRAKDEKVLFELDGKSYEKVVENE